MFVQTAHVIRSRYPANKLSLTPSTVKLSVMIHKDYGRETTKREGAAEPESLWGASDCLPM